MRVRSYRSGIALRLIIVVALAVPTTMLIAAPATAHHCIGDGEIEDGGGDVVAECHGVSPGRPGGSSSALWATYCADIYGPFEEGLAVEFERVEPLSKGDIADLGLDPTGVYWWWLVMCVGRGAGDYIAVEEEPPVPPEELRDRAAARLVPPAPVPGSAPPMGRDTFVNFLTWLWVEESGWVEITESETAGLTTVTVAARPVQATWSMGDGEVVVCGGPGLVWREGMAEDATDCGYTYRHSSYGEPGEKFQASVTVTWEFAWWLNGTPMGVFGEVDRVTSFPVGVAEIQAVETGG